MARLPALGGGGGSYTYVDDAQPANPEEGETWYDVGANSAFVYDGAAWVELTITGHGQLSSVSAGQHRSDSNIRTTVDGQVDADTVDGKHAGQLGGGAWTEDANSPFTASGDASLGGSFADTYDLYKLVMHDVRGSSGSFEHLHLTFNGATQYYGYVTVGGNTVNGASAFRVIENRTPNAASASGYLFTTGRFSNQQQFRNLATQFLKDGSTDSGACNDVSSPVGSFDLSWTNGSITGKVRVYGRDV